MRTTEKQIATEIAGLYLPLLIIALAQIMQCGQGIS